MDSLYQFASICLSLLGPVETNLDGFSEPILLFFSWCLTTHTYRYTSDAHAVFDCHVCFIYSLITLSHDTTLLLMHGLRTSLASYQAKETKIEDPQTRNWILALLLEAGM